MVKMKEKIYMMYVIFKEYIVYIKDKPSLLWRVPIRLWEEFFLHARYILAKISGNSKNTSLIQDLHKLSDEMSKADAVYKPSLLWKDLYEQFERVLHVEDIEAFKTQRYNRRFSAFAPTDIIFFKMFLWVYWQNIKTRDSLHLLEKLEEPKLGKGDTYTIQGKTISHDLLQSVDEFYAIYPEIKHKKDHQIIAELGAGYGRLGYVFLNALPNSTYIIIDLPGSLIIAQYYMKHMFAKEKILTYQKSSKMKTLDKKTLSQYKVVFLAPWQMPLIEDKALDIFINIYSFQEMTMPQIKNYFSLINEKCKGLFYSKQYFQSENPKDSLKIDLKDYPVNKKWKEIYVRTSTVHQLSFETLYRI